MIGDNRGGDDTLRHSVPEPLATLPQYKIHTYLIQLGLLMGPVGVALVYHLPLEDIFFQLHR